MSPGAWICLFLVVPVSHGLQMLVDEFLSVGGKSLVYDAKQLNRGVHTAVEEVSSRSG